MRSLRILAVALALGGCALLLQACALGPPQRVVETIERFHEAGVRHVVLDFVGPYEQRDRQIERFATEALPLLAGLRKSPA